MHVVLRVFISAVSSEFGPARDAIAADLRARGVFVRVQSDFRQEAADTLLRKLHDYVRDCGRVVCVIGAAPGAFPTADEATPFAPMLPPGITEASYTQWEFFFARHFNRRLSVHVATAAVRFADGRTSAADLPPPQQRFVDHLVKEKGIDWSGFATPDQLRIAVLREDWNPGDKPIVLPYGSLGALFKGRDAFLRRLHDSLHRPDGGTAAIAGRAVHGMGGVGKTRAAVEYALAYAADYTALLFVLADTPDNFRRNLAELTGPLLLTEHHAAEQEIRLNAVLAWLRANPGWLLILDNLDSEPALAEAQRLMGSMGSGHVVLTSRLTRFGRGVEKLDLDVLRPEDATAFLLEATADSRRAAADDATQARAIADELGHLALALEMAAATIERRALGFAAYRALWREARDKVLGWAEPKLLDYPRAVAATWQTSVQQLSDPGRLLLELLAFLTPDPVPEFLLDVPVPGASLADAREALADLAAYSLVTRGKDAPRFAVHRLVQDVTRRALADAGTAQERLTQALSWVNAAFTGDPGDVRSWARLDPLAPHAEAVAGHADAAGIAAPTARLMGGLGLLFGVKALHGRAEPLYRRALAIDEASFGRDHPNVARDLNNLAQLLQATNRLAEAEPLMRRALAIDEASFGRDHPNVAIRLNNLAALLQATNRLAEAEPLMRRALAITFAFERSTGHTHPSRKTGENNYAVLLAEMGKTQSEIDGTIAELRREAGLDTA